MTYNLDFLEEIVNVHFGGVWMAIGWGANRIVGPVGQGCEVDFPGFAGGTPGFILPSVMGGQTAPAGFFASPHTITKKDFTEGRTLAGLGAPNFGVFDSLPGGVFLGNTAYFVDCGRFPEQFSVKFTAFDKQGGDAIAMLFQAGSVKVGGTDLSAVVVGSEGKAIAAGNPLAPSSVTWRVDQKKMTISQA